MLLFCTLHSTLPWVHYFNTVTKLILGLYSHEQSACLNAYRCDQLIGAWLNVYEFGIRSLQENSLFPISHLHANSLPHGFIHYI